MLANEIKTLCILYQTLTIFSSILNLKMVMYILLTMMTIIKQIKVGNYYVFISVSSLDINSFFSFNSFVKPFLSVLKFDTNYSFSLVIVSITVL